ncbi:MAG: DUF58 domain-containing protein [Burkholderiales bacterium]|nr:MAG: DUF58 domain-containing protein [Burkholderiales bacterium]
MKNWLRKTFSFSSVRPELVEGHSETSTGPVRTDGAGAEALLKRLEWTTIRRLDGALQGDYRTLFRGAGLDFADLREYQSHDDVRHIDWNVTARTGTPHVRVFTEDREMATWFVMDLSASVDFGSGARRKRDVANELAVSLSRVLTGHGNRVGALLYGGGDGGGMSKMLPTGSGRRHVLHLAHELLAHRAKVGSQETQLVHLLDAAAHVIKRRSTVFVVSDFFSAPGWDKPLAQLARRHDVVAVRLTDPLELQLPDLGMITFRDAETGQTQLVDCNPSFRRRFAEISAEKELQLREGLAQAGVDTLELSTEADIADALIRFASLRRRKSRRFAAPPQQKVA